MRLGADLVRRSIRLANANAALWAIGNGLISTLLVIYLAAGLGATGLAISFILASPRLAGVLRLAVPALIARLRARKGVCLSAYAVSAALLCAVPMVAFLPRETTNEFATGILVRVKR